MRLKIAIVLGAVALVAGCSGSGSSGGTSSGAAGSAQSRPNAAAPLAAAPRAAATKAATPKLEQRDVVRTASVTIVTAHVDRVADQVVGLAGSSGGRVDGDNRTSSGKDRTARIELRVPPPKLDGVIRSVDRLGRESSRTISATDRTAAKSDVDERAAALRTSTARLQQFMGRATRVADLITLENDLTQRQAELQSLLGQQTALADQIDLATLTVSLVPPAAKPKPKPKQATGPAGFGAAFGTGLHGLGVAFRWVLAVLGYAGPWLLVAAVLAAGTVFALRRRQVKTALPASSE